MQDIEIIIHTTNGLYVRAAAILIAKLSITIKDKYILQKIPISYKGKNILLQASYLLLLLR